MRRNYFKHIALISSLSVLVACAPVQGTSSATTNEASQTAQAGKTIEITDARGKVVVPLNPKRVVSLDNRSFVTLSDWGIPLLAAPKDVMPKESKYVADESVINIGNHREPNLEAIVAANPDLVIVGQRFADFYDEIKALVPQAAVIDLNVDVSEKASQPGENLTKGLTDFTTTLGQIFEKEAEADKLKADLTKAIEAAKAAYDPKTKVMAVIVSGGKIGYAAPKTGRVFGPLYEILGWTPALAVDNTSTDHQGDEVSVEAIAQANPDFILVLDRDAATSTASESQAAKDVIENSAPLKKTKAVMEGKVLYAPNDMYTNESIQTFIELFDTIGKAF